MRGCIKVPAPKVRDRGETAQMRLAFPDGIMGGVLYRGGLAYGLPTAGCDRCRHLTGAIESVWVPLAVDASRPRGGSPASVYLLLGYCAGHCGPARRLRIMDAKSVELLGYGNRLCAQPPFGSAGDSPGTKRRNTSH